MLALLLLLVEIFIIIIIINSSSNNNNKKCGPLLPLQLLPIRLWQCDIFLASSQLIQQPPCTKLLLNGTVNNGYLITGRPQCSIPLFSLNNKLLLLLLLNINNNRHL